MRAWLKTNGNGLAKWLGIIGGAVALLGALGFQVTRFAEHLPISTAAADTRYVKAGDEVVGLKDGALPADVVRRSKIATVEDVAMAVAGIATRLDTLQSLFIQSRTDQAAQLQLLIQTLQGIPMRSPVDSALEHRSRPRP